MDNNNDQLKTLQDQLRQQEKLASLGLLTAGIAHEVQNPLNFVINFAKLSGKLVDELDDITSQYSGSMKKEDCEELADIMDDLKDNIAKINEHGERAISIIRGILLVSRGKEDVFIPADVAHIVKEYVWLGYHSMRAGNKSFNVSIREDYQQDIPKMLVIQQDLSRAILNLSNNAFYTVWEKQQRLGNGYKPELHVSVTSDGNTVTITMSDNGEGMNDEVKKRLYDNFFTTKPIGKGTGLGMGITRDIVEKHNGKISFESVEGEYTTFKIEIPIRLG